MVAVKKSRIYYTLLSGVPWDVKGEENVYISLLEEIMELGCICSLESEHVCVGEWLHVCVVLPQRLDSVGCKFSAEHALLPCSAPLPPAKVPKASLADPTSPEKTKQ